MRKKYFYGLVLIGSFFLEPCLTLAAEKAEPATPAAVEKKGVQFIREGGKIVKELEDKNGDGKPDVTTYYEGGVKHHGEGASHFDGKIDCWYTYGPNGALRQMAKDKNGDGRPDEFYTMLKGRNLMLKEADRNFDGRIDKRSLVVWSPSRIKIPGQAPIPGYLTLWSEEDNNFDGKIDVYREKGNKSPSQEKIGKPIDAQPAPAREENPPAHPSNDGPSGSYADRKIKRMNEQHGIKE